MSTPTPDLPDFTIEFISDVDGFTEEMENEAEDHLRKLGKGHTDLVGAMVSVHQPAKAESGYIYQVKITAYVRPTDIAATETSDTIQGALKGALSAIERQVRKKREKLGEPWKRPDIPGSPAT